MSPLCVQIPNHKECEYMLTIYPALFFEENNGSYSVVFPDLNHLSTCGSTLDEAMEMAIDCLAGYIYSEKLDKHELPAPTPLKEIDIHCEDSEDDTYVSVFSNLVTVDVDEYARKHFCRSVKKTVTIPQWLDDMATRNHVSFSKVMQEALADKLGVSLAI